MKILILGVVASGKTTLAKRMSEENNINYYACYNFLIYCL